MKNLPQPADQTEAYSREYSLPGHHAFVRVPAKYLYTGTECLNPAQCQQLGETPVYFSLHRKNALKAAPLDAKHPSYHDLPPDYVSHDLSFTPDGKGDLNIAGLKDIPALEYANPNHRRVCQGCLDQHPSQEISRLLAARILLQHGTLSAKNLVPHPGQIDFAFYDKNNGEQTLCKRYPKVCEGLRPIPDIPQEVAFSVNYDAAPLTMTLQSFGAQGEQQTFSLQPPSGQHSIEIDVVNLPGDTILGRTEVITCRMKNALEHFNLYYIISRGTKGPFLFPVGLGTHGAQPFCAHVQLSP
ncbi:MAG TPA: hypothetical protein VHQ90_10640 [Thermoanaerobaculia bacterium]|nr:hypothetical protein [Thermoanaerobaculia bacterium]